MITTTAQNARKLADLTTHDGTRRMRPTEVVAIFFDPTRTYDEPAVNDVLRQVHDHFAASSSTNAS
jgi:hypothetical protein